VDAFNKKSDLEVNHMGGECSDGKYTSWKQ
jgi:hypothetical protein